MQASLCPICLCRRRLELLGPLADFGNEAAKEHSFRFNPCADQMPPFLFSTTLCGTHFFWVSLAHAVYRVAIARWQVRSERRSQSFMVRNGKTSWVIVSGNFFDRENNS